MIAQAQSGTGKTATFTIGILQQLDLNKLECQALVLAPTRELAQQIQKVCFLKKKKMKKKNSCQKIVVEKCISYVLSIWLFSLDNNEYDGNVCICVCVCRW